MKLYVIGNGFDIAHNLPTKYSDFKSYVSKHNPKLYQEMNDIYNEDKLWSDFEKALGNPSKEYIDKPDKIFGIKNIIGRKFANEVKRELGSWICSIDYDAASKQFEVSEADLYLSFNYTDTLNVIYGIDVNRIKFIHGFAAEHYFGDYLVIGHNNKSFDGYELIESTYKDSESIIKKNKKWFDNLTKYNINEVEVIGHSYNEIDIDYFKAIKEAVPTAKWILNTYSEQDKKRAEIYIKKLNLILK